MRFIKFILALMAVLACIACASSQNKAASQISAGRSASKLSIHTGFCFNVVPGTVPCSNADLLDYVATIKPKIIKVLDGFAEAASQIKAKSPNTLVIGRIYYPDQEFDFSNHPKEEAQRWWSLSKAQIIAAKAQAVDYWEGINEPRIANLDDMKQYALFEKTRIELLAKNGKAACIGNFSQGTPDINVASGEVDYWREFLPAIDAALIANNPRGILCLHEYSMTTRFQDSVVWHIGRYRQVYEYLRSVNRAQIKLAITEFGIDANSSPGGWKAQFPQGNLGAKADAYITEMLWFDREYLQKDDYVLGAMIFAHGMPSWGKFDIAELFPALTTRALRGY